MTPTTEALARHVAARVLAGWVLQHPALDRSDLARIVGEEADEYGRTDLDCGPDSPAVAATEAAITALTAELVRHCRWAPPGGDAASERLLARLTVSGQKLRDAGLWFPELDAWYVGHLTHRRDQPAKADDMGKLAAMAAQPQGGDREVPPKVAPLAGQRERVDGLAARLVETEVARLEAVRDGHRNRHNDLANMNRDAIGEAAVNDLRSLVTRWMLERGKAAFEAKQAARPRAAGDPGE